MRMDIAFEPEVDDDFPEDEPDEFVCPLCGMGAFAEAYGAQGTALKCMHCFYVFNPMLTPPAV